MKIAIIANSAWYLHNFRLNLAQELREAGHQVLFISAVDSYTVMLQAAGFEHMSWDVASAGMNPLAELGAVWRLRKLLVNQRIDALLSYTPKANIYSGLALWGQKTLFLPNISGLGRAFIQPSAITLLVVQLYRLALRQAHRVIFQNMDDLGVFTTRGVIPRSQAVRVPGSGVDLRRFEPSARAPRPGPQTHFLFVGRLLKDKGAVEFAEAARVLKRDHPDLHFTMLGSSTSDNPTAVSSAQLREWKAAGLIEHQEHLDDVRPLLDAADCVVLPSYREGVPRSLLEAAAMAKPLVTTDAPGCRDTVVDGDNGYLCQPRSVESLAQAMRRFIDLDTDGKRAMGQRSRALAETTFDERIVIDQYLRLLSHPTPPRVAPQATTAPMPYVSGLPTVHVLLATYCGEAWLDDQLDTLLGQQGVNLTVTAGDDASTDGTLQILKRRAAADPRLTVTVNDKRLGSAAANFYHLLKRFARSSTADYIALADHDDVWEPNKLARHIALARSQAAAGVSSDVIAFWPNGRRIYIRKSHPQRRWDHLFEPPGPGCTFLMTRAFACECADWIEQLERNGVGPLPKHDWFIYLVARSSGYRWHVENASSMFYRQHPHNEVGANAGAKAALLRLRELARGGYHQQIRQAIHVSRIVAGQRGQPLPPAHLNALQLLRHGRRRRHEALLLAVFSPFGIRASA
ncbi:glycosyltransferase [Roseateles sp. NT4]|uniref:glycosyltransferase n=1 Tax=Roseateles sp. NT4 TaxID=3453715 RepID=UPI003EED7BC5